MDLNQLLDPAKQGARNAAARLQCPPSPDGYARGRRDGLRLALAVLAAEEEKWAALLGEGRSGRANAAREVRHKALRVAQSRLRTALNRLSPRDDAASGEELAAALEEVGL